MNVLRQSTASQTVIIGPFLDEDDAITPLTGLTIANTDIKLMKAGGSSANKNSGGATHRVNGEYAITLDATDTATTGELMVSVVMAGALPVRKTFRVVEEAVYDALFASSAAGYLTTLGTNAPTNWINAAAIASNAFTTAKFADGVFTAAKFASDFFSGIYDYFTGSSRADAFKATGFAVAGDEMDLVNALNATAVSAIQSGLSTFNAASDQVIVATNNDKTGYALSAGGLASVTSWTVGITGNITGNLSGSVGSVTAAVETDSASRTASKATATEIRSAVGLGSANLDTQLGDIDAAADVAAGILATLTEDVSGLRFTEKALEEAPTGSGGGGDDAATIYSYFSDGTRPNIFKADVSGLVETGDLPANFSALGINGSGHVSRVTLVDTTTTNTDMRGTDSAYTGTPPTEAEIYNYFSDGSRPDVFKADVSGLSTYDGSDTSGTTTLLSRLSSARAGYLDKLNVSGVIAHTDNASSFMADVSAIPNATAFEARTLPTADYATLAGQTAIAEAIDELPEPPDEETIREGLLRTGVNYTWANQVTSESTVVTVVEPE